MALMIITDNVDGTYSGNVTDNGDGTLSSSDDPNLTETDGIITYTQPTGTDRDIDVTASPVFTNWHTMGVTGYPISTGKVNADNGYSAGKVNVGLWVAGALVNQWSAGPIWIQE